MLTIYEQGKAKGGTNWGVDPTGVKYVAVDSCVTFTLVYEKTIVGSHWGVRNEKDELTSKAAVAKTLKEMMGRGNGKLLRRLLIGNCDGFNGDNGDAYSILEKCWMEDEKWDDYSLDSNTGDIGGAVDLLVYPQGSGNVCVDFFKTGGAKVKTVSVEL